MGNKKRLMPPARIHPAVIVVWAAIVAAAHIIPAVPMLGTGSNFSLAAALSPLAGVFFGPIAGAFCSAVGGFIGSLIAPHTAWMGMGTFIIGTVTAFSTGCIAWGGSPLVSLNQRGSLVINGAVIVYIIGTVLWFSQETGRSIPLFPLVYYSAGFGALIVGSLLAGKILSCGKPTLQFFVLWLCAFSGMIGGAAIGNFFFLILYRMPRETWLYLTVASPLERAAFSLAAALIGIPLLAGLPKIGIFVGPQEEMDDTFPPPPQAAPPAAEAVEGETEDT